MRPPTVTSEGSCTQEEADVEPGWRCLLVVGIFFKLRRDVDDAPGDEDGGRYEKKKGRRDEDAGAFEGSFVSGLSCSDQVLT